MERLRIGQGMLLGSIPLICILILMGMSSTASVTGEVDYQITNEQRWEDTTIFANSIEVKESGSLIIKDTLIIMNNSAPYPDINIHGHLNMSDSKIIPLYHETENRYSFKVYGSCLLSRNEIIRANSVSLFSNDVELYGNTIRETKADGIFMRFDKDPEDKPKVQDNTIEGSQLNGIRILDANGDLMDNRLENIQLDGIHVSGSEVEITNMQFKEIGMSLLSVGENTTVDIYSMENLTSDDVDFRDETSMVRIHKDGDVKILEVKDPESQDYMSIAILLGVISLLCLVGVNLFYQWNKDKARVSGHDTGMHDIDGGGDAAQFKIPKGKDTASMEAQIAFGDMAMGGAQYEAALDYYNEALNFSRSDNILVRRGNAFEKMKRYQEAYDSYEAAYKINKENKDAIEGMWWLRDIVSMNQDIKEEIEEADFDFIRNADTSDRPKRPDDELMDESLPGEQDTGDLPPKAVKQKKSTDVKGEDGKPLDDDELDELFPGLGPEDESSTPGRPMSQPMPQAQKQAAQPKPRDSIEPAPEEIPGSQIRDDDGFPHRDSPLAPHGGGPERSLRLDEEFGFKDEEVEEEEIDLEEKAKEELEEDEGENIWDFRESLSVPKLRIDPETVVSDLDISSLYFENKNLILKQIATALGTGKHIIFYGPPGTGKSCIARAICETYGVDFSMVTGTSDWSTFDTIGGYMLEEGGDLRFAPGLFLRSLQEYNKPINRWLIIDEINRADIDKAFGPFFSVLAGDNVVIPQKIKGRYIEIIGKPKEEHPIASHRFFIHPDWHLIATLNTFDKASLYEMSYAFMRRFSFISIPIPEELDEAVEGLVKVWKMDADEDMIKYSATLWKIINNYRKIGPAIVQDILRCLLSTGDYTSAINMYVLPQFEGLETRKLKGFMDETLQRLSEVVDMKELKIAIEDFFNVRL